MSATTPAKPSGKQLNARELAAWRGMLRVHSSITRALDADLLAEHGLSLSSYEVLLFLDEAPADGLRMAELADSVLLSRSGLTRLVDRLEQEGLAERRPCPSDLRGFNALITPAGSRKLREARKTHLAGVRVRFLEHFSASELDAMAGFWERAEPGASADDSDAAC